MSKIIRGARLNQQPVQIKINLPYMSPIAPAGEKNPEIPDIVPIEEISEAPPIDVAEQIAKAEAEVQSIVAEAQAQAQQIISEAQRQAQQLIDEAQQTALQFKDDAMNQGEVLGYQQGMEKGYGETAVLLEQAGQIVAYARQERDEIIEKCEKDVLDLAMSVAARVIHTEVTINPDIVLAVVKDAIQKAKDQEQVIIRVNPADFETIAVEKQTLQAILRRETGMEIRGDIGVEVGGCVIETDYGAIDARIDTQLETIKDALVGVVKHV